MFCFHWAIIILLSICACQAKYDNLNKVDAPHRSTIIGDGCDGCKLMYVNMPENISAADTTLGWYTRSAKKLLITGRIYQPGGKIPASGVLVYFWHTDTQGRYTSTHNSQAQRHGDLRGWIKTDSLGRYWIYTSRPAPYPGDTLPSHIHLSVKEPNLPEEYYIEDIVFDDDPLLIPYLKSFPSANRGGSGVVRILMDGDIQMVEHNIILGLNIPHYPPKLGETNESSGLSIGEDQPSFMPYHVFGPDQFTTTCPVCKYGRYHGIIFFLNFPYDRSELFSWLLFLEAESQKRSKYLKVYIVFNTNASTKNKKITDEIRQIGKSLALKYTALTIIPSWYDTQSEVFLNKINMQTKNTMILYKHRNIINKFVDIQPNQDQFEKIRQALDSGNEWFELPGIQRH